MSTELVTAFTTGFSSVSDDVMTVIGAMLPIGMGIAGTVFVVKKAVKWFKTLAG